jgi:hypothetical protein
MFTVVVLAYKAPLSLTRTLLSLRESGVARHPLLHEVVVYFQAMDANHDSQLVRDIAQRMAAAASGDDGDAPLNVQVVVTAGDGHADAAAAAAAAEATSSSRVLRIRVVGSSQNLPVAKATFAALAHVTTPLVLYLECDRPAIVPPRGGGGGGNTNSSARAAAVSTTTAMLDTAIRHVVSRRADVFRLQVYAHDALPPGSLPRATYGDGPWLARCDAAPRLTARECAAAKQRGDRVFVTAYCKHWAKLERGASSPVVPQQDMCDSLCFPRWSELARKPRNEGGQGGTAISDVVRAKFSSALSVESGGDHGGGALDSDVLCTTSEWCNWTNQPTLFRREWYERAIMAACLARPRECVGSPGRRSAVLQEVFFVKNAAAWRERRYRVCLHRRGLFFHNEIDNRESSS